MMTIIVAGHLFVDPAERDDYLRACVEVMVLARRADGCIDFSLTPDPIDSRRINVFEQWDSVEAVEAFRGSGPSNEQATAILDAEVYQHSIGSSIRL
jgi:quinol monooxygenase YgiN